jgi:hypothetical protein
MLGSVTSMPDNRSKSKSRKPSASTVVTPMSFSLLNSKMESRWSPQLQSTILKTSAVQFSSQELQINASKPKNRSLGLKGSQMCRNLAKRRKILANNTIIKKMI